MLNKKQVLDIITKWASERGYPMNDLTLTHGGAAIIHRFTTETNDINLDVERYIWVEEILRGGIPKALADGSFTIQVTPKIYIRVRGPQPPKPRDILLPQNINIASVEELHGVYKRLNHPKDETVLYHIEECLGITSDSSPAGLGLVELTKALFEATTIVEDRYDCYTAYGWTDPKDRRVYRKGTEEYGCRVELINSRKQAYQLGESIKISLTPDDKDIVLKISTVIITHQDTGTVYDEVTKLSTTTERKIKEPHLLSKRRFASLIKGVFDNLSSKEGTVFTPQLTRLANEVFNILKHSK